MKDPTTVQECDEQLRWFSKLSEQSGLPVIEDDGTDSFDRLLDLRLALSEAKPE